MHLQRFVTGPFQENTFVIHEGTDAVLIDPGCATTTERRRVLDYIKGNTLEIQHILLTHGHIDHILDLKFFCDHFEMGYEMQVEDLPMITEAERIAQKYEMRIAVPDPPLRFLTTSDTIQLGAATWQIRHTPGHSPGSVCFWDDKNGFLVAGDVLFAGSVGRTDLWKGSMQVLTNSIRTQLYTLPPETIVYCGHGRETTIGAEISTNPFVQGL
ncbi:MAG TPA: MBL fold metallo-hydrolase [Rhodothermales bacterium]|nr:MBL fold metallo-hydrolase [Rhodothermales bacterium]HRR10308.1 MBL fold metallo-hydrolase [Rhodothermales bacterium]